MYRNDKGQRGLGERFDYLDGVSDGILEGNGIVEGSSDGILEGVSDGIVKGVSDGILEGSSERFDYLDRHVLARAIPIYPL